MSGTPAIRLPGSFMLANRADFMTETDSCRERSAYIDVKGLASCT